MFILSNIFAVAEEDISVDWRVRELLAQANSAFAEQNLERALTMYLAAEHLQYPLPEAQLGIATVYHADGAAVAAERYYIKALTHSDVAQSDNFGQEVRYKLANLYQELEQWKEYEETLLAITNSEPIASANIHAQRRRVMHRVLTTQGIDRALELYQLGYHTTLQAHARLGIHFVERGNYAPAATHLLFATIKKNENILNALRQYRPSYQFTTLAQLLQDASQYPLLVLEEGADIYQLLYYLAAAILGDTPNSQTWRTLWTLVAQSNNENWGQLAQSRLNQPQLEAVRTR